MEGHIDLLGPDISKTYRGYRLQAFYALFRLLSSNPDAGCFIRPEGIEDVDILSSAGTPVEIIQVKALSTPLVLSDLQASEAESFLYRAYRTMLVHPDIALTLVHFGELGRELERLVENDADTIRHIARRVSQQLKVSIEDSLRLVTRIQFRKFDEAKLVNDMLSLLEVSATGADVKHSFDLLYKWMLSCSETRQAISRTDLFEQVMSVGSFVSERFTHKAEWFVNITPLSAMNKLTSASDVDAQRFREGISVQFHHIVQGLDIPRMEKLESLRRMMKLGDVTIVRGASGQGKSALVYRYMYEFVPEVARFQIRDLSNVTRALAAVHAIREHIRVLAMPMVLFLDVKGGDEGWIELVSDLAGLPQIKIIIAVREEDWQRTRAKRGSFSHSELELTLSRREALEIWEQIPEDEKSPELLKFNQAWKRFGGRGPLMEFLYLATSGTTLSERLASQVARLQDEEIRAGVRSDELRVLRLVAVATESESRLAASQVAETLDLFSSARIFDRLDREYLLQFRDKNGYVEALHPIRSRILTKLLIDDRFSESSWRLTATYALKCIIPDDLGNFLLYSALAHAQQAMSLHAEVQKHGLRTWAEARDILRYWQWIGIREFTSANTKLFRSLFMEMGRSWYLFVDLDLAEINPGLSDSLFGLVTQNCSPDRVAKLESLRADQRDKGLALSSLLAWFFSITNLPQMPTSDREWQALGEVAYWAGRTESDVALDVSEILNQLERQRDQLTLESVSLALLGLYEYDEESVFIWLETLGPYIRARILEEHSGLAVEEDADTVMFRYWVTEEETSRLSSLGQGESNPLHAGALRRIEVLRGLYPHAKNYSCQGYGHHLPGIDLPHDETLKSISAQHLAPRWAVSMNVMARGTIESDFRPSTLAEYERLILQQRKKLALGISLVASFLLSRLKEGRDKRAVDLSRVSQGVGVIASGHFGIPMLPRSVVGPWGSSEFTDHHRQVEELSHQVLSAEFAPAIEEWRPLVGALDGYSQAVRNFSNTIASFLVSEAKTRDLPRLAQRNSPPQTSSNHDASLVRANITDMLVRLPILQQLTRKLLTNSAKTGAFDALDRSESRAVTDLWHLWRLYVDSPGKVFGNPIQESTRDWAERRCGFIQEFQDQLDLLKSDSLSFQVEIDAVEAPSSKSLLVRMNVSTPLDALRFPESVVRAVGISSSKLGDRMEFYDYAHLCYDSLSIAPLYLGRSLASEVWNIPMISLLLRDPEEAINPLWAIQGVVPPELVDAQQITPWDPNEIKGFHAVRGIAKSALQCAEMVNGFRELLATTSSRVDGHELDFGFVNDRIRAVSADVRWLIEDGETRASETFVRVSGFPDEDMLLITEALQALRADAEANLKSLGRCSDELLNLASGLISLAYYNAACFTLADANIT